jgi:2-polyprenyl-3-methyl-5-hydroxy-6-metoxy-1,4-benzoquinol methylase
MSVLAIRLSILKKSVCIVNKMLKIKRDYISDRTTNEQELLWWNENAEIVSRVWEMHEDISWTVRKHYLNKARDFFYQEGKTCTILELGCGSGWVGQFIAGPQLKIVGTDFSEQQIQLAQKSASLKSLDDYCEYVVSNSSEWPEKSKEVDGVLIHAFMHHLDGKEIEELLHNLGKNLKSGTKVWIYEPAFYRSMNSGKSTGSFISAVCLQKTAAFLVWALRSIFFKFSLVDQDTYQMFTKLSEEAKSQNWHLSPKEVPLDVDQFTVKLQDIFVVQNQYWATLFLIGWVFDTNLLKNAKMRKLFNAYILPVFALADRVLSKNKNYVKKILAAPTYAFHVWECILK